MKTRSEILAVFDGRFDPKKIWVNPSKENIGTINEIKLFLVDTLTEALGCMQTIDTEKVHLVGMKHILVDCKSAPECCWTEGFDAKMMQDNIKINHILQKDIDSSENR